MMAARPKRMTGKPPEENRTRDEGKLVKEKQKSSQTVVEVEENQGDEQELSIEARLVSDFPFRENVELPNLENTVKSNAGFQNRAPLQADERVRELLMRALQHP